MARRFLPSRVGGVGRVGSSPARKKSALFPTYPYYVAKNYIRRGNNPSNPSNPTSVLLKYLDFSRSASSGRRPFAERRRTRSAGLFPLPRRFSAGASAGPRAWAIGRGSAPLGRPLFRLSHPARALSINNKRSNKYRTTIKRVLTKWGRSARAARPLDIGRCKIFFTGSKAA